MFHFKLAPIEAIEPWTVDGEPSLSWFALSDGEFWIELGEVELLRYTQEVVRRWPGVRPYAAYQVAAMIESTLDCVGPSLQPVPEALTNLALSPDAVRDAQRRSRSTKQAFHAWRWLNERSPAMEYFDPAPHFWFVRAGDLVVVTYDHRECLLDDVPAWTAQLGSHVLPVADFSAAAHALRTEFLAAMAGRIDDLAAKPGLAQCAVDLEELRAGHAHWAARLQAAMAPREPDVSWAATFESLAKAGIELERD